MGPLYDAVTFVMLSFHSLFDWIGLDPASGWAWGGSIVGLVVVIRIVLIPLFVQQIKAQRGLQTLQPEIKKIQAKYKGKSDQESRQKQSQEMMKLYKDTGTNPLSSCLPILAQAPIFFALFHVLNGIGKEPPVANGLLTLTDAKQAAQAKVLGAPIADAFLGANSLQVQIVTALLIIVMSATTFITQKQLMTKNMPAGAMEGPFAQQQKIMLYAFPLIFAVSGINFPVGVLLYWLTTNLWTMGQQFYVIRRNPTPGSAAAEAMAARRAAKASRHGAGGANGGGSTNGTSPAAGGPVKDAAESGPNGSAPHGGKAGTRPGQGPGAPRQRQQPRRQNKRKR
jgi:YidC/Oxa1 family membrane protein insertase